MQLHQKTAVATFGASATDALRDALRLGAAFVGLTRQQTILGQLAGTVTSCSARARSGCAENGMRAECRARLTPLSIGSWSLNRHPIRLEANDESSGCGRRREGLSRCVLGEDAIRSSFSRRRPTKTTSSRCCVRSDTPGGTTSLIAPSERMSLVGALCVCGAPVAMNTVTVEIFSRIVFARMLRELSLSDEMPGETRPPRPRGRYQGRP